MPSPTEPRVVTFLAYLGWFLPILLPATLVWSSHLGERRGSAARAVSLIGLLLWGLFLAWRLYLVMIAHEYHRAGVAAPF